MVGEAAPEQASQLAIWFTGLSGTGKSTLARAVEEAFFAPGSGTVVRERDKVRHVLGGDLGFSEADRKDKIRCFAK